ncbi:TlpA family protein disulfide reductase [Flavobacterium myungsuense]|uniref:TlpA family protein disulfide reductase n=1 Tax=Flavobacterium myungsuense TaxID=651823 RepID=A0ABW3J6C4_9FLAO
MKLITLGYYNLNSDLFNYVLTVILTSTKYFCKLTKPQMFFQNSIYYLFFYLTCITLFSSCNKEFKADNYTAYFGGEVTNANNPYVLFCKDSEVIDTIKIDINNRFFIKFDSLTPGLYTFKNEPEYQYIYFDKNDSIMVHINSKEFDESIVYCGRGDEKNNFLMELYLKNEKDRSTLFDVFDYDFPKFNRNIDSVYATSEKFYATKKEQIKWSDGFDTFAKAALDFHYFSKKEMYPVIHKIRTGVDLYEDLPKNYYAFRKSINFNCNELASFSPYIMYLSHMLNNVGAINYHNHFSNLDLELKTNINKLNIADTLIKNKKVKNTILNNIAFSYLLEDQNMVNNHKFLEIYNKYSTDKSKKNEIQKIGHAIQLLKVGNELPEVMLIDKNRKLVSSNSFLKKKTVIFFWTEKLTSHLIAAQKKIASLKQKYPDYQFIAINLDDNQNNWNTSLSKYNFDSSFELRSNDFEDLKTKWAIIKVHRTIVLNSDTTIKNAFTNIFDVNFENNLK